ncbi:transcription factor btd-like [Toxorhynchites rutilus septentrionalis]|uniref:transcription factor btd-like n=1 Tax=Toxorhynchites rutilus septentrionalis TaxID=329112 RepID=UPI0024798C7A|nr:transcription factor btd-like [Toxorhynchites rutilus septentrionalis]
MFSKLLILACLLVATAFAEPGFEHPSLSYGANLLGGFNPELYTTVKALSPLQYGSSYPLLYSAAAQLYANSLQKPVRQYASAPLQYASAFPVSYAAPAPLAYTNQPTSHLTYGAIPSPLTYAGQSFYNPQYASYAAAPVYTPTLAYGSSSSSGGSGSGGSPSASALNYAAAAAAAAANAQALGNSAYTTATSVQGALDAALGRSAELFYGRRVPFAFTGQTAAGAATQEAARQAAAVQFPSAYNSASALVETPAQARSDSQ